MIRDKAVAVWDALTEAGYTATITSSTHENMLPRTIYQLSVGPRRMRFVLEDLIEVKALLPEGYTLSQPLDNSSPMWTVVLAETESVAR